MSRLFLTDSLERSQQGLITVSEMHPSRKVVLYHEIMILHRLENTSVTCPRYSWTTNAKCHLGKESCIVPVWNYPECPSESLQIQISFQPERFYWRLSLAPRTIPTFMCGSWQLISKILSKYCTEAIFSIGRVHHLSHSFEVLSFVLFQLLIQLVWNASLFHVCRWKFVDDAIDIDHKACLYANQTVIAPCR